MRFSLAADVKAATRYLTNLEHKQLPKAINSTVNDIGKTAQKEALKHLSQISGATQASIKRGGFWMVIRSRVRTLAYTIRVRRGAISLRAFGARQTKKGVTAKAWGKRRLYKGAFKVRKLNDQVFKRRADGSLKKLWGPQPSKLTLEDSTARIVDEVVRRRFRKRLKQNLAFHTERARRR